MGLEPTTFWMQTRCSSQLSYVPEGQDEDSGGTWASAADSRAAGYSGSEPPRLAGRCRLLAAVPRAPVPWADPSWSGRWSRRP